MEKTVKYVKKQRDDMRNMIAYLDALSGTESAMESGLEPRKHPLSASPSVITPASTHVSGKCTKTWDIRDDSIIQAVITK